MTTPFIAAAHQFLQDTLLDPAHQGAYQARYEHTLRVAQVGRRIARAEGLDEEALVIACLLHDVGYARCHTEADYDHHGAISAAMVRAFLTSIGYDEERMESICYGIEIHTEREEDYRRPATPMEFSVGDADNIDRFDAFRLYLALKNEAFDSQPPQEIIDLCAQRIARYQGYKRMGLGTSTARLLWDECLDMMILFYSRLQRQMEVTMVGVADE
ncbi:MAG: HD domain-containing protein [Clostridiales bacterium]|nr:HD domain-containing protein [Clostridiales bacterium]